MSAKWKTPVVENLRVIVFIVMVLSIGVLSVCTACMKGVQSNESWVVQGVPVSGYFPDRFSKFDHVIVELLKKHDVPAASIALSKDGRLVLARGYGWKCRAFKEPTQPYSLFRIASVSKPITAVAVMKLVEEGKLCLQDRAFGILDLKPLQCEVADARINSITIQHLLEHSAGWDRGASFDPLFSVVPLAQLPDDLRPPSCETLIQFMLGKRLNFNPGSQHAYSNLGYCVLGEIIEEVSGMSYEQYVQSHVLAPAGISAMRIGGTRAEERVEGEVCYYDYEGAHQAPSVYPEGLESVPQPYGSFYLPANAANGGWIASTIDLTKFMLAVDGQPSPKDILENGTIKLMWSRPDLEEWELNGEDYYGFGWEVSQIGSRKIYHHNGAMAGTRSVIGITADGFTGAVLLNSDPKDGAELENAIVQAILSLFDSDVAWPEEDLMERFDQ
jgi:N-acyl-D-amino-acid deacylase